MRSQCGINRFGRILPEFPRSRGCKRRGCSRCSRARSLAPSGERLGREGAECGCDEDYENRSRDRACATNRQSSSCGSERQRLCSWSQELKVSSVCPTLSLRRRLRLSHAKVHSTIHWRGTTSKRQPDSNVLRCGSSDSELRQRGCGAFVRYTAPPHCRRAALARPGNRITAKSAACARSSYMSLAAPAIASE